MTDTTITGALTVSRIPVPETADAADAGPFRALARLSNAACRHDTGHDYFDTTPEEMLPSWRDQTDRGQLGFIAERDGEIVGVVKLEIPLERGATEVEFEITPAPARWGEGIEDLLLATVEAEARASGRRNIQTWTLHRPDAAGDRLSSPAGLGTIPADDRQTQFMLQHGFVLGQVERNSVFDLAGSFTGVERMLQDAAAAAGPDYRVVSWTLPTPEEYRVGFAYAISRMSTDVPVGDMIWTEEHWDAARVERRDARLIEGGQTVSISCAQHVPTGRIAAYTELVIGRDLTGTTHQWGTLVLKEHRGRRLGALVKCANLLRWREVAPESPRVSTFNAEENRHMLDINEAMGFVPASYAGAWEKVLT